MIASRASTLLDAASVRRVQLASTVLLGYEYLFRLPQLKWRWTRLEEAVMSVVPKSPTEYIGMETPCQALVFRIDRNVTQRLGFVRQHALHT